MTSLGIRSAGEHGVRVGAVIGAALVLVAALPSQASAHHAEVVDKLESGAASLVSVSSMGERGDADSGRRCGAFPYSASDDGRLVAFASVAGNLSPADVNGRTLDDVFVYDRGSREIELVSALPNGLAPQLPPLGDNAFSPSDCFIGSHAPAISGNGRFVAFVSNLPLTGPDQLPQGGIPLYKVFVRDLKKDTTDLVSITWDNSPATGSSGLSGTIQLPGLSISDDGRFVAFTSMATNILDNVCPSGDDELAPGVASPVPSFCEQTYVRDRKKKETILVSRSSSGEPGDHRSQYPSISGNGRYVAFESGASNLVESDMNQCLQKQAAQIPSAPSCSDVFVHDLRSGATELISNSRLGLSGSDASVTGSWGAGSQTISDDGRFVAFSSQATDIVPAQHHLSAMAPPSTYVKDRKTGRTERISVSSTGAILQGNVLNTISDDGRFVMFNAHLMDDVYVGPSDVGGPYTPRDQGHEYRGTFLHDRRTGQLDWALVDVKDGATAGGPDGTNMNYGMIGGNGRFVVGATDRADGASRDIYDVYVRDLVDPPLGTRLSEGGGPRGGSPADDRICIAPDVCIPPQGSLSWAAKENVDPVEPVGAKLYGISLAHRPQAGDLFLTIELEDIGPALTVGPAGVLAGGSPTSLYGMRFMVRDRRFEVRATSQLGGTFGLFDCTETAPGCTQVHTLKGGYGTTGEEIVVSIPLSLLGLEKGTRITHIECFSAMGTFASGSQRIYERLRIH